ncbi:MAG: hypothetical protein ACRDRA_12475 [Pseudonocardiaceae bacterium]
MRKTTTSAGKKLTWYLRSLGDHDTHCGLMRDDGTVLARCGALFTPRPTWRVEGPPPGQLVTGGLALRGSPPDPDQVRPQCQRGGDTR